MLSLAAGVVTFRGAIIFFGMGGPKYTGGDKFSERKIGGHKLLDDQNVRSYKMTTDSVFILLKRLIAIKF